MFRRCFGLILFVLLSCRDNKGNATAELNIALNKDSTELIVKGLSPEIIRSLAEDSISTGEFQSLFFVCVESGDEDMRGLEKPLSGKYRTVQQNLVFKPDSLFSKGNTYRAEVRIPAYYSVESTPVQKRLPGGADVKIEVFAF